MNFPSSTRALVATKGHLVMKTVPKDIRDEILNHFTFEQVRECNQLLSDRWKFLQLQAAREFKVGDVVSFRSKLGQNIIGKVEKVNRKTVKVNVANRTWSVSPNLLTLV